MRLPSRALALGGVVGPAAFVASWAALGTRLPDYSPVRDPISRLAAVDAATRPAMTLGFVAFGAGVSLYAVTARSALSRTAATASALTAAATLGIAALPLGGPGGDRPHAAAAAGAYAALAATQFTGGRALLRSGHGGAGRLSMLTGAATALALAASAAGTRHTGLLQRTGLTIGDVWIAASALWMLRDAPATHRSVRASRRATR